MLIFEEFALKNKSIKQNEVHISKPNDKVNLEKLNFLAEFSSCSSTENYYWKIWGPQIFYDIYNYTKRKLSYQELNNCANVLRCAYSYILVNDI